MSGGTVRGYRCTSCGKECEERYDQAHVIFIYRNGNPRTYELCAECTEKIQKILEGEE